MAEPTKSKETSLQTAPKSGGEIALGSGPDAYDEAAEYLDHQLATLRMSPQNWLKSRRQLSKMQDYQILNPIKVYLESVTKAFDPLTKPPKEPASKGKPKEFKNVKVEGDKVVSSPKERLQVLTDNFLKVWDNVLKYGSYTGGKVLHVPNVVNALMGVNAAAHILGTDSQKVMIDVLGYDPKVASQLGAMTEFTAGLFIPTSLITVGLSKYYMAQGKARLLAREEAAEAFAKEFTKFSKKTGFDWDESGQGLLPGVIEELPGFENKVAQAVHRFADYFRPIRDDVNKIRQRVSLDEQAARFERGEIIEEVISPEIIAGMQKEFGSMSKGIRNEYMRLIQKGDISEDDVIKFLAQFYPVADAMPEVFGRAASAGRSLRQFGGNDMNKEFNRMFEFFSAMLDHPIDPKNWAKSKDEIMLRLGPMMQSQKLLDGFLTKWGKAGGLIDDLGSIYKLNLISGPITQAANIIGGSTNLAVKTVERPFQAAYGKYILGDKTRAPMKETGYWLLGMTQGLIDGARGYYGGSIKYGATRRLMALQAGHSKLEGALEHPSIWTTPLEFASAGLNLGDTVLRTAGMRGTLLAQGLINGAKLGHSGDELLRFARDFADNPSHSYFSEALEVGNEMAATLGLGPIGTKIAMLRETADEVARIPIGTFMVTFLKASTSMLKTVYNHTPVLSLLSTKTFADMGSGNPQRIADAAGRIIATNVLSGIGFGLAALGVTTGDGPIDPQLRAQWRSAGWEPRKGYGLGVEWNLARMSPLGDYLAFHANLYDLWKTGDLNPDDAQKAFEALGWVGMQMLNALNPYQMLGDMSELFDDSSTPEKVNSAIGKIVGNFAPYSGLVRQVRQIINPDIRNALDEYKGLEESAYAQVGGWKGRYKRDIFGRVKQYHLLTREPPEPDPDADLIKALGIKGLHPPDNYLYGKAMPSEFSVPTDAAFPMNQDEADYFAKAKGIRFRQLMENFREEPEWTAQPDHIKRQTITTAWKVHAEKIAFGDLVEKYPAMPKDIATYFDTKAKLFTGELEAKDFKHALELRLSIDRAAESAGQIPTLTEPLPVTPSQPQGAPE